MEGGHGSLMTTTKILTLGIALVLFGTGAFAMSAPSGPQIRQIAQATPEPSPIPANTPEPGAMPVATTMPMPMTTPLPSTNGTMPVTSPGTIDLKHGGTTGNSNGDNWLDKFNRNPGPDTSGMQGVNTKYMHPGAPTKVKVKVKKHPPSGM